MPPKISPKDKAAEKQMLAEAEREAKGKAAKEKEDAASWAVGAKTNSKAKESEEKEAEKRQKAAEKAALEAAENAELGNIVRVVKTKKVGKDDFDLLNAALAKQPKTKAQKDAEAKKKVEEERKKKEAEARELKEQKKKVVTPPLSFANFLLTLSLSRNCGTTGGGRVHQKGRREGLGAEPHR